MKTLIYLTGPQGSGKSTFTNAIANKLNWLLEVEWSDKLSMELLEVNKGCNYDNFVIVQQERNPETASKLLALSKTEGLDAYFFDIALNSIAPRVEAVQITEALCERPLHLEDNNYIRGHEEATKIIESGKKPLEVLKIKSDHRKDVAFNSGWTDACLKASKLEEQAYKHTITFDTSGHEDFLKGYAAAKKRLLAGEKVENLLIPFEENVNYHKFDIGWNKACGDIGTILKQDNILYRANQIVNERSEEKERQYGPFEDSMDNMRDIFNAITGLDLNTEHMYKAMIAAKLSRERFSHKEDNLLDLCSYTGSLNNYLENQAVKK